MCSVFKSPISSFFCQTREVCSQIAEIRIRVQNDPKDTVFVLELQKISTQNTKKHITQNTCAQHTNPDIFRKKSKMTWNDLKCQKIETLKLLLHTIRCLQSFSSVITAVDTILYWIRGLHSILNVFLLLKAAENDQTEGYNQF